MKQMQQLQYVVYINNEEPSPATHSVINQENVDLSKPVFIEGSGEWE